MASCKDCIHYDVCVIAESLSEKYDHYTEFGCGDFKNKADFAEVKHGEWIQHSPDVEKMRAFHELGIGKGMSENSIFWTCSCCGSWGTLTKKYCSECGAKMDGGKKE